MVHLDLKVLPGPPRYIPCRDGSRAALGHHVVGAIGLLCLSFIGVRAVSFCMSYREYSALSPANTEPYCRDRGRGQNTLSVRGPRGSLTRALLSSILMVAHGYILNHDPQLWTPNVESLYVRQMQHVPRRGPYLKAGCWALPTTIPRHAPWFV